MTLAVDDPSTRSHVARALLLRKLPGSGVSLDLPLSPQVETIVQGMAQHDKE